MPLLADRHWSPADVRALPDDGVRYECIDGALLVTPAPRLVHQDVLMALFLRIEPFVRRARLGKVLVSPADIELEPGALVQPDLYVARPAEREGRIRTWQDIAGLLLAVEVLSPSTARYDRGLKRRFYQRANVGEYWIVDADARLVERWLPADSRPEIIQETLTWQPEGAPEAWQLDLRGLFAETLDG